MTQENPRWTRDKAWIGFGFLCFVWLAAAAMTGVSLVTALGDPDAWPSFAGLLVLLLAVTAIMALNLKLMPPRSR